MFQPAENQVFVIPRHGKRRQYSAPLHSHVFILWSINEQIWKTALLSLSHADIKNIKRINVRVTCTISHNFCALFGICSFIVMILWCRIAICFSPRYPIILKNALPKHTPASSRSPHRWNQVPPSALPSLSEVSFWNMSGCRSLRLHGHLPQEACGSDACWSPELLLCGNCW